MKTILVISDQSPEAATATRFALMLARTVQADLVLATTVKTQQPAEFQLVLAGPHPEEPELSGQHVLEVFPGPAAGFVPQIKELDVSAYPLDELVALINREGISLLVAGMVCREAAAAGLPKLNIQSVLNRVRCPLMLVPHDWHLHLPERITYLADLRYCRVQVLRYLNELGSALQAPLTVAHLAAAGLTEVADSYAADLFRQGVLPHAPEVKVSLSHIRERDPLKAVDVLIHGLHQDLLVFVNHRYHFEEVFGRKIGDTLPAELTVPVLIFPL